MPGLKQLANKLGIASKVFLQVMLKIRMIFSRLST